MVLAETQWDLLVVGAGPAGSRAAATAAAEGISTVLIDAKRRIGEQPHCGEYVPARLFSECGLDKASVIQSVSLMETRILGSQSPMQSSAGPGERGNESGASSFGQIHGDPVKKIITNSSGYLIDRVRFDRDLAGEAAAAGVTVLCCCRFVGFENDCCVIRCGSEKSVLNAKFIVAADGAISTVAHALGFRSPEVLKGVQVEVPLENRVDRTFVFLHPKFFGGYGWLFPKGKVANVGVGVASKSGIDSRSVLGDLLEALSKQRMIRPGRLAVSSGLIPVSGPRTTLVNGNVIFAGDAAGLTHPITGAGIPQAVVSGELAGRVVSASLKTGDRRHLADYEAEIMGRYGGVIRHALSKRTLMIQNWNHQDFESICMNTWIAFDGYKKRVLKDNRCNHGNWD